MRDAKSRSAAVLLIALVVLLAVSWWSLRSGTPTPPQDAHATMPQPLALAPRPLRTSSKHAMPSDEPVPVAPNTTAVGHSVTAERLGLVAIRCWVGTAYDSDDLVGGFHQRIEDGWYSHVENEMEGSRGVERRFLVDPSKPASLSNTDFETLFRVSWRAQTPGETVPCEVEWPAYGELTVIAVGEGGELLPGALIDGCGAFGETEADGRTTMQVFAGEGPCVVRATAHVDRVTVQGQLDSSRLAEHETRTVKLELSADGPDVDAARMKSVLASLDGDLTPRVSGNLEQAALFDQLAESATGTEADLYRDLARHRRSMAASAAKSQERMEALEDLQDRVTDTLAAGETLDAEAWQAEMDELMGDLIPKE